MGSPGRSSRVWRPKDSAAGGLTLDAFRIDGPCGRVAAREAGREHSPCSTLRHTVEGCRAFLVLGWRFDKEPCRRRSRRPSSCCARQLSQLARELTSRQWRLRAHGATCAAAQGESLCGAGSVTSASSECQRRPASKPPCSACRLALQALAPWRGTVSAMTDDLCGCLAAYFVFRIPGCAALCGAV